jgi:hypothetical protein
MKAIFKIKMKFTLRLLTTICYFLPFTFFFPTCNGLEIRFAYNQTEANQNILLEMKSNRTLTEKTPINNQNLIDTVKTKTLSKSPIKDSTRTSNNALQESNKLVDIVLWMIIRPTKTSLSGIGCVLYFKNIIGKIALAICIFISLFLLVAFKFLKSKRIKIYLLITSILLLTVFIINCFISSVTLLWGTWLFLILLVMQVIIEFKENYSN